MACPYFYPLRRVEMPVARAPLHVMHEGVCRVGQQERTPEAGHLELCNFGYARNGCAWFPADSPADAVRFARRDGGIIYILEKDWSPAEFGDPSGAGDVIRRQAEVFLECFPNRQRIE